MKSRNFNISEKSQWDKIYEKLVEKYLKAGKVLSVSIGPYSKKRSTDANRYYWGVLLKQISQQMPAHMDGRYYEPDVWHIHFRKRFLPCVEGPDGEMYPRSTTKLSVTEFMGYCDEITAWAIDEGVYFDVEDAA